MRYVQCVIYNVIQRVNKEGSVVHMSVDPVPVCPDLAHERAMRAEFNDVVNELRDLLGRRLVAYLGAVKETRAVNQWADGERTPGAEIQTRLRLALQVALMIADADGAAIAQAWFQGMNPQLGDRAPARVLRDEAPDEAGPAVLAAARVFLVAQRAGGSAVGTAATFPTQASGWESVRRDTLRRDAQGPKGELLDEAMRLSRFAVELAAAGRMAS